MLFIPLTLFKHRATLLKTPPLSASLAILGQRRTVWYRLGENAGQDRKGTGEPMKHVPCFVILSPVKDLPLT